MGWIIKWRRLKYVCVVLEVFLLADAGFHAYCDGKVARFGWISAAVAWSCLLMTDLAVLIK